GPIHPGPPASLFGPGVVAGARRSARCRGGGGPGSHPGLVPASGPFPLAPGMVTIKEMAILVVDDDQAVRDSLRRALALQGYDVELAGDGEEALFKLRANPHATDLLVVDLLMPRLDGLELTRRLRADGSEVPILMLTARDQVADRVEGLEAGADDYLVKPFALEELVARVRALLRRLGPDDTATKLSFADLELDTGIREVRRGDETLTLTRTEFAL